MLGPGLPTPVFAAGVAAVAVAAAAVAAAAVVVIVAASWRQRAKSDEGCLARKGDRETVEETPEKETAAEETAAEETAAKETAGGPQPPLSVCSNLGAAAVLCS